MNVNGFANEIAKLLSSLRTFLANGRLRLNSLAIANAMAWCTQVACQGYRITLQIPAQDPIQRIIHVRVLFLDPGEYLVSHYSAIGDTISCDAPYSAIGFRGKLFLRYLLVRPVNSDCDRPLLRTEAGV